jgi:hypothetical protein
VTREWRVYVLELDDGAGPGRLPDKRRRTRSKPTTVLAADLRRRGFVVVNETGKPFKPD